MPDLARIRDRSYIGGMDTVQDPVADSYPQNRCTLLRNCFPGDPPVPRRGMQDLMVDTNDPSGYQTLFKPPALILRAPNDDIVAFVLSQYTVSPDIYVDVEMWNETKGTRTVLMTLHSAGDAGSIERYYTMLPVYNGVMVYCTYERSEDISGNGYAQHMIEWNATTEEYEYRANEIPTEADIDDTPPAAAAAASNNGLTGGYWVSYQASYIRRSLQPENPEVKTTFSTCDLEQWPTADFVTAELDTHTDYSFGDTTTELKCEELESGIFKYTWTGSGTDPNFATAIGSPAKAVAAGDYVEIASTAHKLANTGIFKVREVTDDYIVVENESGVDDTVEHAMTGGYVRLAYTKVTITLPSALERTVAAGYGATHLRLYRSDHAQTEEIAKGLIHRFLVDLPIYGTNFAATWADTISRATLLGETNYYVMANYTNAPLGRYAVFAANRIFLAGDPEHRGRMWYTEVPGGDGGTSFGTDFPMRYTAMWNQNEFWIDFDPDDGQIDTGVKVLRDDIYFFKEKKVFVLRNADVTQAPDRVSESIGCLFPNTLLVCTLPQLGEVIFFISNIGPTIIRPGGSIKSLSDYAIAELWPGGELIDLNADGIDEHSRERVHAFYHENTIWVVYGDSEDSSNSLSTNTIWGWHISPKTQDKGCLEVTIPSTMTLRHSATAVAISKGTHTPVITGDST